MIGGSISTEPLPAIYSRDGLVVKVFCMAAPHVTGVASLLYSLDPLLTPAQVLQILQNTVTNFPGGSTCNTGICGSGIVNAGAAVSYVLGGATPTPTSTSTATATSTSTATETATSTATATATKTAIATMTPTQPTPQLHILYLPVVLNNVTRG